ncbi:MAG TPA: hypothetical protein VHJ20_15215 [Polyangia bacterium]|nr:hypothetical protein [Polyangia bacterium]
MAGFVFTGSLTRVANAGGKKRPKAAEAEEAAAADETAEKDTSDSHAQKASEPAPEKADETTADEEVKAPPKAEEPPRAPEPAADVKTPMAVPPPPLLANEPGWQFGFFGWAELDAMWDSTQSFSESVLNQNIARPYTIAGDNARFQATPKDSRLGFKAVAPTFEGMKASAYMEADFFGVLPTTATQDQSYTYSSIRLRQYYAKLETPFVDVLAGQTFDLFGFGGGGFFPSTPAFLGVMGEVFHRNVQLRLSKTIMGEALGVEIAVAGVRPASRDAGLPDGQAGLKLLVPAWQGASAQGPRPAKAAPAALGVSGVGRRVTVTDFNASTGNPRNLLGWGVAADLFLPIIPAHGEDLSNTFSVTGEYSRGTGVTDLYLTLTGGVLFPSLPNPNNVLPAPQYTPNLDNGIVTFDADGLPHTINWEGMMVNGHYHFPFRKGKMLALSGTYSRIKSSNALSLTPLQNSYFVWDKGQYIDGTLWWRITPAFQMSLSYQTMQQTYGDGTVARNNRAEASWWFFF